MPCVVYPSKAITSLQRLHWSSSKRDINTFGTKNKFYGVFDRHWNTFGHCCIFPSLHAVTNSKQSVNILALNHSSGCASRWILLPSATFAFTWRSTIFLCMHLLHTNVSHVSLEICTRLLTHSTFNRFEQLDAPAYPRGLYNNKQLSHRSLINEFFLVVWEIFRPFFILYCISDL